MTQLVIITMKLKFMKGQNNIYKNLLNYNKI